ncbi:MAG: hypothetical protein V1704_03945 [Candidatus Vogelbacteria bacterium]
MVFEQEKTMTTQAPVSFSLATPLFLEEIVKELSQRSKQGLKSVVERICDNIIADLNGLCELVKKGGGDEIGKFREVIVSCSDLLSQGKGPAVKTKVGLGLGYRFLGLGFLENAIIAALKVRFLKMGASVTKIEEGGSTATYSTSGESFSTSDGTYELTHTHSWFVKKIVDA